MIMLFIDDARDITALSAARKFPAARVLIKVRGEALSEQQRNTCPSFEKFVAVSSADVSARQVSSGTLLRICGHAQLLDSMEVAVAVVSEAPKPKATAKAPSAAPL